MLTTPPVSYTIVNMNQPKRTQSQARKDYWATVPKEERTLRARKAAKAKAKKMTPAERSAHGKMMIAARNNKK